jgi:FtsH-binding integral membrane protein
LTAPGPDPQPSSVVARRWTVIASGLLLLSLALVVIYTRPLAFQSPTALVVVAAIGVAALFLEVRFRRELPRIHPPLGLTILGILCAAVSFFADFLHLPRPTTEGTAFAAVICFGISGTLILHALGKLRKSDNRSK